MILPRGPNRPPKRFTGPLTATHPHLGTLPPLGLAPKGNSDNLFALCGFHTLLNTQRILAK